MITPLLGNRDQAGGSLKLLTLLCNLYTIAMCKLANGGEGGGKNIADVIWDDD